MEVVEKSLSFIKDNYINQSKSENENPINNESNKKSKETENKKKKKKYTKRFKILKHCLNQLKYNGISIDLYKFSLLIMNITLISTLLMNS